MITKIKLSVLMMFLAISAMNCGDDEEEEYSCKSCADTPDAAAANDNSGKGIYKGIVVGSSGTIEINVANTGSTITGILVIDGETINLAPYENDGVYDDGYQGYLSGSMDEPDDVVIWFSVNSNGSEYYAEFESLPGHTDAVIQILKEYSTLLVRSFEGTYGGDASGVFNLVVYLDEEGDGEWYAVSKNTEGGEIRYHSGEIIDDEMSSDSAEVDVLGEIDDDEVSGTWTTVDTNGTWKGKRTL